MLVVKDDVSRQSPALKNVHRRSLDELIHESEDPAGSYNPDGHLRPAPDETAFYGLDRSKCDLTRVVVGKTGLAAGAVTECI